MRPLTETVSGVICESGSSGAGDSPPGLSSEEEPDPDPSSSEEEEDDSELLPELLEEDELPEYEKVYGLWIPIGTEEEANEAAKLFTRCQVRFEESID